MKTFLSHLVVLSCRKATFLIEKQQVKPLFFVSEIQLNIHLKLCSACVKYQKQSILIEKVLKENHPKQGDLPDLKLSEVSKSRIQKALTEKLKH